MTGVAASGQSVGSLSADKGRQGVEVSWTGTWATAQELAGEEDMPLTELSNCAVRQVVHVSIGGERLRLRLSNVFGDEAVELRSVYVADAGEGCEIAGSSARYLSFSGKRGVRIEPGETVTSDELLYALRPLQRLSITVNYGGSTPRRATCHRGSRTTSFIMAGESKPRKAFRPTEKVEHWYNIASIEVPTTSGQPCIAVLGNSITDGRGSTTDGQDRWTDVLAEALGGSVGVLNLGIGGNCLVEGGLGQPGVQRFERDILGQAGVTHLVIFEGINDIGGSKSSEEMAHRLIDAYGSLMAMARERGIKVLVGTLTPMGNSFYWSYFHEAARQTVNEWIRALGPDGVIDFDAMMRDADQPTQLRKEWQSDWLHPNAEGYQIMGRGAAEAF